MAKHHQNTPLTAASSYKPGALAAHAGICAGGEEQSSSPRNDRNSLGMSECWFHSRLQHLRRCHHFVCGC
jgi:hypothetical protein